MTPRERDLLMFIRRHTKRHGTPPTYEAIKNALGLKAKSGVSRMVQQVVDKGLVFAGTGPGGRFRPGELELTAKAHVLLGTKDYTPAQAILDQVRQAAEAGLCQASAAGKHSFLQDIVDLVGADLTAGAD